MMMEKSIKFFSNTDNVFLFLPNIIAYLRIILALLSFLLMPSYHILGRLFIKEDILKIKKKKYNFVHWYFCTFEG